MLRRLVVIGLAIIGALAIANANGWLPRGTEMPSLEVPEVTPR